IKSILIIIDFEIKTRQKILLINKMNFEESNNIINFEDLQDQNNNEQSCRFIAFFSQIFSRNVHYYLLCLKKRL
ncbi:MAG: hypothetical protein IJJ57_11635, partial [Ruminococcus sp.]|nr:hypothetical protein [Ruminococcus sp.]